MKWTVFLSAMLMAACSHSQPSATNLAGVAPNVRGSLSPSAPVNLTYQVERAVAGQPLLINVVINTRLNSGSLLIEVAKQEGAAVIGATTQRVDLATATHPIALPMQATLFGAAEHYLVLLLTIDTEMGPMSRSFRIDLAPTDTNVAP